MILMQLPYTDIIKYASYFTLDMGMPCKPASLVVEAWGLDRGSSKPTLI